MLVGINHDEICIVRLQQTQSHGNRSATSLPGDPSPCMKAIPSPQTSASGSGQSAAKALLNSLFTSTVLQAVRPETTPTAQPTSAKSFERCHSKKGNRDSRKPLIKAADVNIPALSRQLTSELSWAGNQHERFRWSHESGRWGSTLKRVLDISAMTFTLSGFDAWTFQIVCCGSLLILEALRRDGERLSTVLQPMDCTRQRAHALIRQPSCTLLGH
jgi:hypothetical protein